MATERENMLRGEMYLATDPELVAARIRARRLWQQFNNSAPDRLAERAALLSDLLGRLGDGVQIEPPFFCDYGTQIPGVIAAGNPCRVVRPLRS